MTFDWHFLDILMQDFIFHQNKPIHFGFQNCDSLWVICWSTENKRRPLYSCSNSKPCTFFKKHLVYIDLHSKICWYFLYFIMKKWRPNIAQLKYKVFLLQWQRRVQSTLLMYSNQNNIITMDHDSGIAN